MKAKSLAALAILSASMGMGAVPQEPTTVIQRRPTAINSYGGYTEYLKVGRSPKEYGQWLQYNRMQKWNKGGKK